jgi:hypothetical protein
MIEIMDYLNKTLINYKNNKIFTIIEYMINSNAYEIFLKLLENENEKIRELSINLIGFLLNYNQKLKQRIYADQIYGLSYFTQILKNYEFKFSTYQSLLAVFIPSLLLNSDDEKYDDNVQNYQIISVLPVTFNLTQISKLEVISLIISDFKQKLKSNNIKHVFLKQNGIFKNKYRMARMVFGIVTQKNQ